MSRIKLLSVVLRRFFPARDAKVERTKCPAGSFFRLRSGPKEFANFPAKRSLFGNSRQIAK